MFAEEDGADKGEGGDAVEGSSAARRKAKEVHFMEDTEIVGQEFDSKGGGQVRLDDEESSDGDDQERELAVREEGIDEEVGLGGLKRNAPKLEAFNMKGRAGRRTLRRRRQLRAKGRRPGLGARQVA